MKQISVTKIQEVFTALVLLALVFVGIFGMNIGMAKDRDGNMRGCLLGMRQATMCQMNITEHLIRWQQGLMGITKNVRLLLAVLLSALVILPYLEKNLKKQWADFVIAKLRYYKKQEHVFKLFHYLPVFFSRGILNPRIYA